MRSQQRMRVNAMKCSARSPVGYYQSLRLIPPIFGGHLEVTDELDGSSVAAWLTCTAHRSGRAVYVPMVNNSNGRVLSRPRAQSIAAAVLAHSRRQQTNPAWVIADDVYATSVLDYVFRRLALAFLDADACARLGVTTLDDEAPQAGPFLLNGRSAHDVLVASTW